MKAKLIKDHTDYHLVDDEQFIIGTTDKSMLSCTDKYKLSFSNCQAIERGYSPSELSKVLTEGERGAFEFGYCLAREHNGNKKFSEEDLDKAFELGKYVEREDCTENYLAYKQSLQQTEWDVEIVEEPADLAFYESGNRFPIDANLPDRFKYKPKLDAEGCLILKFKSE